MRGRKPKPTRIKALAGNPGKRRLNAAEPEASGRGVCPQGLDAIAKAEWRRVAPKLAEMGILSSVDRAGLAAYCSSYSIWRRANAELASGLTVKTKSGRGANPLIKVANGALDQMRKFMVEFGMTPSSRSRLTGTGAKDKDDNPFAELASEHHAIQ